MKTWNPLSKIVVLTSRVCRVAMLLSLFLISAPVSAFAQTPAMMDFTPVGDLSGGAFNSQARGVSSDGSVVVGFSTSGNGASEAFRWQGGTMTGLGSLTGGNFFSQARGVSANGSVVVGASSSTQGTQAFRWQGGTMTGLGDLAGGAFFSEANAVNADGSVVVGFSSSTMGSQAFRWTQGGGMVGLGDLAGGTFSSVANGVSGDGSVVVGNSSSTMGTQAFRWTQGGGMVALGDLTGGGFASFANAVSADGSVVVGSSTSGNGTEAFRWQGGTMAPLGDLTGGAFFSEAFGVNADGSVVVGRGFVGAGDEAFRWTQAGGMVSVQSWLASAGVSLTTGWTRLTRAYGVSADGNVVVGHGLNASGNTEVFIARVIPAVPAPAPGGGSGSGGGSSSGGGSGVISLSQFSNSIMGTSGVSISAATTPYLAANGAHHRPLLTFSNMNLGQCAWASADGAWYDNQSAHAELIETGFCHDFIPERLRAGIGIGKSFLQQDLVFNGDNQMDGEYVMAEVDYLFSSLPILASVSAFYNRWDVDVDRGYQNGASLDQSSGETNADNVLARARLDWLNAVEVFGVGFSPRAAYTYASGGLDGYTEYGGGFPIRFNDRSWETHEVRYGIDGARKVAQNTVLRGMVEGVHRFSGSTSNVSGQVIGLFGFSLPSTASTSDDWVRGGVEVEQQLLDNISLSASVNASSQGQDPTVSGGLQLRAAF